MTQPLGLASPDDLLAILSSSLMCRSFSFDAGAPGSLISTGRMKRPAKKRRLEYEEGLDSEKETEESEDRSVTLGSQDTSRSTSCERGSNSTRYESETPRDEIQDWLDQYQGDVVRNEDGLDRESASPYEPRAIEGNGRMGEDTRTEQLNEEDRAYLRSHELI